MNCLSCSHKNPATVTYCQKCGKKLDFTADDITGALVEKAKGERMRVTEHYVKQSLLIAVVVFGVAMTLFILSGGAPVEVHAVPSVSGGAKYVEVGYRFDPPVERALVPFPGKKP